MIQHEFRQVKSGTDVCTPAEADRPHLVNYKIIIHSKPVHSSKHNYQAFVLVLPVCLWTLGGEHAGFSSIEPKTYPLTGTA